MVTCSAPGPTTATPAPGAREPTRTPSRPATPRATSAKWDDPAELEEDYDGGALDVAQRFLEVQKATSPRDGAPTAGYGEAHRLEMGYFHREGRFP